MILLDKVKTSKIKSLKQIAKIVAKERKKGRKVGLITGCFDIFHIGHVELFDFAKKYVDILIVGLDNDKTIELSKGKGRPVYNFLQRSKLLSEISLVDYIFKITKVFSFQTKGADKEYVHISKILNPNYLITDVKADKYWKEKRKRAEQLGIKFLPQHRHKITSSSYIIQKLQEEF